MKFDGLTIGGVVRDVLFYTDQGELIKNKKNNLKQELLGFEFGAKIYSKNVHFSIGGGAANTSINFSNLGLKTGVFSQIGSDFNAQVILNEFKKKKVNTLNLKKEKNTKTGFSFLVVDKKSGEHTVFAYRGAAENLEVTSKDLNKLSANWLYVASLSGNSWKKSLTNIFLQKSSIAWNPGSKQLQAGYRVLRPFIKKATIFNVNKDEAIELVLSKNKNFKNIHNIKSLLIEIYSWGLGMVVITNGNKGAYCYDGRKQYFQATLKNKPIDTAGAGDCFGSTFVTGIIKFDNDIQKAMKLATVNASSLVNQIGAQSGLLKYPEALKRINKI